jgi:hypothetical protein
MKTTNFPIVLLMLMIAGLLLAATTATVAGAQDDDNPWSSGDDGTSGTDGSGDSAGGDSGSDSGTADTSDGTTDTATNDDDGTWTNESSGSAPETRSGPIAAPIGRFALGMRTWGLGTATNSAGPFTAGATFRMWIEEGFGIEASLGLGLRDSQATNTEVSFLLGFGTFVTIVEKSPVWIHFGQRVNFGLVSNSGGAATSPSELMFEFPLVLEYFITQDFSLYLSFGISIHIITGDGPVFSGAIAGATEGFNVLVGRGNVLGGAGFVFWF